MTRHSDIVEFWWMRDEFAYQREDWQTGASWDQPGADLLGDDAAVTDMLQAGLGEPQTNFTVTAIFDSRIVNGYDFNFTAAISGNQTTPWNATFTVPVGYRAVPRFWDVHFDQVTPIVAGAAASTASILQGGAALPNNAVSIGLGTTNPIKTFFICEESTTFGITGIQGMLNLTGVGSITGVVNVSGNLIPVTQTALPLATSNEDQLT